MNNIKALKAEIKKEEQNEKNYNRFMNEGGEGYYHASQKLQQLRKELYTAEENSFAEEWTVEITINRRDQWNVEAQLMLKKYNGKVPQHAVLAAQEKLGFSMRDLGKAAKLHNLQTRG